MDVLSHPFRLTGAGTVATVEQGGDVEALEAVAVLLATRPGERPLVPAFGTEDPTFATMPDVVDLAGLQVALGVFGPYGVNVALTATNVVNEMTEQVTLEVTVTPRPDAADVDPTVYAADLTLGTAATAVAVAYGGS